MSTGATIETIALLAPTICSAFVCHALSATNVSADANISALAIWQSSESTLQQRTDAARRLIPLGTKQIDASRILGASSRRVRRHGPSLTFVTHTNTLEPQQEVQTVAYVDEWRCYYDFSTGDYVCVTFDINASATNWKVRPVIRITSGNTNSETIIRFKDIGLTSTGDKLE